MQEVEMMNKEIQVEVVKDEVIRKISIMQKEIAELKHKRSSYTGTSRTTAWRKKQKTDTSLNVKASPDLSHLFLAVDTMKRLQLSQPPSETLLANALSLVSRSSSSIPPTEIIEQTPSQTATYNSPSINKEKLEMRCTCCPIARRSEVIEG
ncbi:18694_t:CDS:2 [Racocetra fulgida]|uniref:18694_t:CDS:1 n=1 Tax=Racocetra fulgida TaxID=60492 RepID=A0A9N8ZAJ6_9GLOM|nr:18694_t:CDS:2 [Racocetra fulgida]